MTNHLITDTHIRTDRPAGSTDEPVADLPTIAVDLYRDIHKGLRAELFAVTLEAGRIDPICREDRLALAAHVSSVRHVLESHAHHEDSFIEPQLSSHLPELAEKIAADHGTLEPRFAAIDDLATQLTDTPVADVRRLLFHLYHELSGFTSAYLAHQLVEERIVMPALQAAIGVEAVVGIHVGIVTSIPPVEMAQSLSFMLPAMNADDRAELLGGIRAGAPADAFQGVLALARSVLEPADYAATTVRLDRAAAEVAS